MKTVALPFSGCGYSFSSSSSSSTSSSFKILIVMAKNNKSQSSSSKFRKRKSSLPLATAGRKSRGRTFLKIRSYIVILPQPFTSNTFSREVEERPESFTLVSAECCIVVEKIKAKVH